MSTKLANLQILSTSVDGVQPIQNFRLFTGPFHAQATDLEFFWGLEKGELDLWSPLNCISVRADVARLFLDWELGLIPSHNVLKTLADTIEENIDSPIDQRRCCFEVLPPGEYEYDLVPLQKDSPCHLFVIGDGSNPSQQLDLDLPHFPRVRLNVHPAFAFVHAAYQLYPSVHENRQYYRPMAWLSILCCERASREFRARPDVRVLPRHVLGQEDDQNSSEFDDSEDIPEDDDYPIEDGAIRIHSWLEAVPKSAPVEEVSGKSGMSEAEESTTNTWQDSESREDFCPLIE
ncbi:hypothetical protein EV361DRAFT_951962 [Lentinula raphanica]|nr:hypothetical protein EV361DRAFT_951962 [Lentinula raphanica]